MAIFLDKNEVYQAYTDASKEADQWREDYPQYERLMDNGLLDDLDPNLPEVNDGSLAASLFKLAKRVIRKKMAGRAIALDRDDAWLTELANLQWENNILKNAKSKASPRRKWKDAVRKAAGYGSQPIITLFVERGNYTGADFIVPYCQDVKLEAGKDSDEDSDIIFWDVYYTKLQLKNMIEQAKEEMKEAKETDTESYNKWNVPALEEILNQVPEEERPGNQEHKGKMEQGVKKNGVHFYIAFQRGVNAPFYMCHNKKTVREWSNPDPSGDIPVHYLYCYQDFINPYGIGIVKLAGGTQNVLDYMRQSHILATQLGFRPPKLIEGNVDEVDFDSLVYAQDADWIVGNAKVTRMELNNQIYAQFPTTMQMYLTSLNKMLPSGETTVSAEAGDPMQSRTPAGVKMAEASLSIDDEDFMENVDECYEAVARSMINTHFANMQGKDLMRLKSDEIELLQRSGIDFPMDEQGNPSQELEIIWDDARATFDFEVDAEADKTQDEEAALEGKLRAYELLQADPNIDLYLQESGKKLNRGELLGDIFSQLTDNDKIIEDISPEEMDAMAQEQQMMGEQQMLEQEQMPVEGEVIDPEAEQDMVNIQAVMEQYGIDEGSARAMIEAEKQGFSPEEILEGLQRNMAPQQEVMA